MKKTLLSIGLLSLSLSASAQILTYVGDGANVDVAPEALVYSGGGIEVVGSGVVSNSGNVMMVGGQFKTTAADGTTPKTDGGNFILKLIDPTNYTTSKYGQLYLTGDAGAIAQSDITGIVDKEYRDAKHGSYQQVGLPFSGKTFASLNTDLAAGFADNRWTQTEILSWDNAKVLSINLPLTAATANGLTAATGTSTANYKGSVYGTTTFSNKSTAYYMLGSAGWDASAALKTIKGVPYADGISETLQNAGSSLSFTKTDGSDLNLYREKYISYLKDNFSTTPWTGDYGKNIYQFGNPFLTNLDVKNIVRTTENNIGNLIGMRYSTTSVAWDATLGTGTTNGTYNTVTFTAGTPIGDDLPVIKPMGYFVLKLADNTAQTLNFDKLRRFAYTSRNTATSPTYDVTAARGRSSKLASSAKSGAGVKQIALVALDSSNKEVGRTYYAVYPNAVTGFSETQTTQATADNSNVIGTFEEAKTGGIDSALVNTYWLYINVANETDFKHKEVPVKITSNDVSKIRIELKEDGNRVDAISADSFYIKDGSSVKAVKTGDVVALSSKDFFVSYGAPNSGTLQTTENIAKPSETMVVYDESISKYKVIFDKTWKTANVSVYDMSGKFITGAEKVNAQNAYEIALPNVQGVYLVTATSETGQKFAQKIRK